jgi:glutamate-1-semialdehyde 2,1-aminomutase
MEEMGDFDLTRSRIAMEEARRWIPGGVNSPVRAYQGVGGDPPFIASASGSHLRDIDGNEYIDYVGSWGPLILGHAHPRVVAAVREAAGKGTSFGAPTLEETRLARLVASRIPGVERVRFVNSGTEATMSALRLARAHTGRARFVKFVGCYHGHGDAFLVQAGSGAATFGVPTSPGVPPTVIQDTLLAPFNDLGAVAALFERHPQQIAAVIVEPVAGNVGCIPPEPGFLDGLRTLTRAQGALFILDEVMTGFRLAAGGAIERFGTACDLVTLGKILGGGLPVGAYAGPAAIMDKLAPAGPVYQAGTLSGNPLAMAAGIATLEMLAVPGVYDRLEALGARLESGMRAAIADLGHPLAFQRVGSMFCLYFRSGPVRNYDEAKASDIRAFARFFHGMLRRGVYLAPSQFEAGFLSLAHTEVDIDRTLAAGKEALAEAFAA